MNDNQALLTEKDVAAWLHLPKTTVRRLRISEKLPHVKAGRRYFYTSDTIKEWIRHKEKESVDGTNHSNLGVRAI